MPASLIAASSFAAAQASRSNIGIFIKESRLTTLQVLRYCSGQKKRWFKFPIQITNYANIVPSHYNVDLAVSYDMGDQPENEYLRNISLQLVVNNVTNKKLKAEF
jgi:outer membrane receptor protein involved in Fe transport